jgi:hypothetical protein
MNRSSFENPRIKGVLFVLVGLTAFPIHRAVAVYGQEAAGRGAMSVTGGPYPRLPGAVTKAPAGLGKLTLFDLDKFFTPVPRDRNAAPLYLDAFFEFGDKLAVCFPEGTETETRRQAAKNRLERYTKLANALAENPKAVSATEIDALIKLYDTGFRKLALAQKREQCVFETSLGLFDPSPHFQGARQAALIASLEVKRAVERKEFEVAARQLEIVLRLARDLQPRGEIIAQLVASALTQVVGRDMLVKILAAPALRTEHCDRILKLLTAHEAKSIDGYVEGLKTAYLALRVTMRDLTARQSETARRLGVKRGESVTKAVLATLLGDIEPGTRLPIPDDADAKLARISPAELARVERNLDRYFRDLLALAGTPSADLIRKAKALKMTAGDDVLSGLIMLLMPSIDSFAQSVSQATTTVRANECLIALRRWRIRHKETPTDLLPVVKAAGLKAVPLDPYDHKPMKMTTVDGQAVIYSVGNDGNDNGGKVDSYRDQRLTGDMIFRMPVGEPGR